MRKPSAETQLRAAKSMLKSEHRIAVTWQETARMWMRQARHYSAVLEAIAVGSYPGEQAALAAKHALDAMKGGARWAMTPDGRP
jgi:hypothetical protein